jgi:uroporphyrinogen decarboxylase
MAKKLIESLRGKTFTVPPIWLMRQAGRYLPEYRNTRKHAGGFLELCFNSDLATEVTLQPIRRYNFDASILFADILLLPKALGMELWFEPGEGPRLNSISDGFKINSLKDIDDIHETLSPIYKTVSNLASELPSETTLIGFAGAPWTVATYMIAGKGSKDHAISKEYMYKYKTEFNKLIDILTLSTVEYLSKQIQAGAEVVKIFDSWAGALYGTKMCEYSLKPLIKIAKKLKARHPNIPIILFPRGVGAGFLEFVNYEEIDGLAIDNSVPVNWAKENLQVKKTVQGNLDPILLVTGGDELKIECKKILEVLSSGPYIFNLGHGITPEANPYNVDKLIEYIRNAS